jgi:hypothetical protein
MPAARDLLLTAVTPDGRTHNFMIFDGLTDL